MTGWELTACGLATTAVVGAAGALAMGLRLHKARLHASARLTELERSLVAVEAELARLRRRAAEARAQEMLGPQRGPLVRATSQHGEEIVAWELLQFQPRGTFVDVGAYDGISLSNTSFFESLGWSGVLVEAHPDLAEACRRARPGSRVVHSAVGNPQTPSETIFSIVEGYQGADTLSFVEGDERHLRRIAREGGAIRKVNVPMRRLADILSEANVREVDLLSVDVEGGEIDVLEGADLDRFRPRLIIVECNSSSAGERTVELLARFGYRKADSCGCNAMFTIKP